MMTSVYRDEYNKINGFWKLSFYSVLQNTPSLMLMYEKIKSLVNLNYSSNYWWQPKFDSEWVFLYTSNDFYFCILCLHGLKRHDCWMKNDVTWKMNIYNEMRWVWIYVTDHLYYIKHSYDMHILVQAIH